MILGRTGRSGTTSIVATGSMPITKIGNTSSSNTTFTSTTVTDGSAWTLSAPIAGDIAKTSGGWIGRITAVDDANDKITVEEWINIANGAKSTAGSALPADGETVTIHGAYKCKSLKVKALHANGAAVHVRQNGAATTGAYGLLADESLVLLPGAGCEYVDATLINAISASGTLSLFWITDCQ